MVLKRGTLVARMAIAAAVSVGALTLPGCDSTGTEETVDVRGTEDGVEVEVEVEDLTEDEVVGEPYDGPYDRDWYDDYDTYVGATVTVSAKVNEIVSPESFTIGGIEDTTIEPLLIVYERGVGGLDEGLPIRVTGVVKEAFDLPTVEEDMDLDLEDGVFGDYDGTNYLEATRVDTTITTDN